MARANDSCSINRNDDMAKGQKISNHFFLASNLPKRKQIFLMISALASKTGQIRKIKALYNIR